MYMYKRIMFDLNFYHVYIKKYAIYTVFFSLFSLFRRLWLALLFTVLPGFCIYGQENMHNPQVNDSLRMNSNTTLIKKTLNEVNVIGDSIFRYSNKDIIRITRYMRKNSYNTGELLGKIPGLHYSRFDKSLSYYGEKNIAILVDSIQQNADYILHFHHIRFDKIEVIPHPQGQYSDYDVVINLHRKADYEGYEGTGNAATQVIFSALDNKQIDNVDWSEAFTYTKNKWNFYINYAGTFHQRGFDATTNTTYLQNNYKEFIIPNSDNSSNSGRYKRTNILEFASDYQFNKRNSFSISYKYDKENNDSYVHSTIINSDIDETYYDTIRYNLNSEAKGYAHSVGLYYRGGIDKWNYNLKFNYVNHTWNSLYNVEKSSGYTNTNNRHQRMNHTLSQVDANRRFFEDKGYLSMGYAYFWRQYDQFTLNNMSLVNNSQLVYHNFWTYISYSLSQNVGFEMSGKLICYNTHTNNGKIKDRYNNFSGSLGFFSRLYHDAWIRFGYSCNVSNPQLNQLTTDGHFTDSLKWASGNPYIKSYVGHNFSLRYHFLKGLTLSTNLSYSPRNFTNTTELKNGYLQNGIYGAYAANQVQNGKNLTWGSNLNFEKEFKNIQVNANVEYNYLSSQYADYKKSAGAWKGNCDLTYILNPQQIYLTFIYRLINDYAITPQSLDKDHYDVIGLSLSKTFCNDNLEVNLSYVLPIHLVSVKSTASNENPAFIYNGVTNNRPNINNVFYINLSYRISGGKSIRKYKREMSGER